MIRYCEIFYNIHVKGYYKMLFCDIMSYHMMYHYMILLDMILYYGMYRMIFIMILSDQI